MLGVSPDDERSHVKFKEKYDLPFTLLADADHETAEELRRLGREEVRGKTYMGVERSTFVIDADGNVAKELRQGEAGHARRRRAGGACPPSLVVIALPPQLAEAIERLVAQAGGSVEAEVERLSAAYRGEDRARAASSRAAVAAYLAYRAPATFAAAAAVFRQVQRQRPDWDTAIAARRRCRPRRCGLGGRRRLAVAGAADPRRSRAGDDRGGT